MWQQDLTFTPVSDEQSHQSTPFSHHWNRLVHTTQASTKLFSSDTWNVLRHFTGAASEEIDHMEFSMGPSVKFVLAIIDSISEEKKWGLIFFAKLDTKGGSVLGISTAIKTALKVAPTGSSKWSINGKVKHYNWTKKIDFSMGPSVKFVLAIIDSISPPKNGG